MADQESIFDQQQELNDVNDLSSPDRIESLRIILEREQHRTISYEEALDIGQSLVIFFEVLAEDDTTPLRAAQA